MVQSNILLQARLIRRSVRRANQSLRYGRASLKVAPILFAISFPKSGTHLLTQVLKGFTHIGPMVDSGLPAVLMYEGDTGRQRSEHEILRDLERLSPGDIAYGHLHATPGLVPPLCRQGVAPFFILRDPRDVVVSHVYYVTEMEPNHIYHHYYRNVLKTFEERLHASIEGFRIVESEIANENTVRACLPNIRERFEPYIKWLDHPEVLELRFEDFVTKRPWVIGRVFDHAIARGLEPSCERETAIQILLRCIDPRSSPTFRSGRTGDWRNAFTPEHKRSFKDISGDLLIRLGYEDDYDW